MTARPPGTSHPSAIWLAGVGLAGAVVLACGLAVGLGFVSDDYLILQRVSTRTGLDGLLSYFRLSHFTYYRPLAFLSFAANWSLWGNQPAGFHLTSLGLHILNAGLVLALGWRLRGPAAGFIASALFALHPSNHEAVYRVASRFDLLATVFVLAGLLVVSRGGLVADACAAVAFLLAVLSKESALGFPVMAIAFAALLQRASAPRILRQLALFAAAAIVLLLLRRAAGVAALGGEARLPKLLFLIVSAGLLLAIARAGWDRVAGFLKARRAAAAVLAAAGLGLVGALAAWTSLGKPLQASLTSIGFAAAHIVSPVALDLVGAVPERLWILGWAAISVTAAFILIAWPKVVLDSPVTVFLLAVLAAALVPISSMTEGTRYLYLALVPASLFAGDLGARLLHRQPVFWGAVLACYLVASGLSMRLKAEDWREAGQGTRQAAQAIDSALGHQCAGRDVILLVAPVRMHGVYAESES